MTAPRRYEITDDEWDRIKDSLPSDKLIHQGRPPKPNRQILNGIVWILRSGAPWRDLPERYGPWQTVYDRFSKWRKLEAFKILFEELNIDADMQDVSIDSTSSKVHQDASGAKKGQTDLKQIKI
jgi:transposase